MVAILNQEPNQLPVRRRPQQSRVVLLLKDGRLVANDDAVVLDLFAHVRRVRGPVDGQEHPAVVEPVRLDFLVRAVHDEEVGRRADLCSLDLVLDAVLDEFHVDRVCQRVCWQNLAPGLNAKSA